MSDEIHYKTFEDHYYESERLNIEARKELSRIKKELEKLQAENSELKRKLEVAVEIGTKLAEFYSNEDNIVLAGDEMGFEEADQARGYWINFGTRANQALKEIKEI